MLVPFAAVVKQFVQTSLHKLLARVGAALLKALLHGAINCINTQLKSTKRAIDCSSLQFLVSQHVLKFIAQTSNFSLSIARGTIAFEPRECVTHLLRQRTRISMQLTTHYYMIIYSRIVCINLNLGHSFILRKRGKENRMKKPRLLLI